MTASRKKVAVLMGGWSAERPVSLVSGKAVAEALTEAGYDVATIDVTHDLGALHGALSPAPDAVFNALHGRGGEDGCIQGVLETLCIPYTHSGVLASAVAMDKPMAKRVLAGVGMPVVDGIVVSRAKLEETRIPFAPPYIVKPADEGSSVGVHIIRPRDNRSVPEEYTPQARLMIERYVPGRELTIGVKGLAGEPATGMPITEIRLQSEVYGYDIKYADGYHIIPCDIPAEIRAEVTRLAVLAHETLNCSGITRTDFRWDDSKPGVSGLYFLEINTQPGMTPFSLVPEQAGHLGITFPQLVAWLVEGARCHA